MDTIEKRKKLVEYIENSDDKIIDTFFSIIQSEKTLQKDFLKYYNMEIEEAMAKIDKGFFIAHEDVEKEAEKW